MSHAWTTRPCLFLYLLASLNLKDSFGCHILQDALFNTVLRAFSRPQSSLYCSFYQSHNNHYRIAIIVTWFMTEFYRVPREQWSLTSSLQWFPWFLTKPEPVNPDGGKWVNEWRCWKHGVQASDLPGDEWQMDSKSPLRLQEARGWGGRGAGNE